MPREKGGAKPPVEKINKDYTNYPNLTPEEKAFAGLVYFTYQMTKNPVLKELLSDLKIHQKTAEKCAREAYDFALKGFEDEVKRSKYSEAGSQPKDRLDVNEVLKQFEKFKEKVSNEGEGKPMNQGEAESSPESDGDQDEEEPEPETEPIDLSEIEVWNLSADQLEELQPKVWSQTVVDMDDLLERVKRCKKDDYEQLLSLRKELRELMNRPLIYAHEESEAANIRSFLSRYGEEKGLDWLKIANLFDFRKSRLGDGLDERSVDDFKLSQKAGTIELSAEQIAWKEENNAKRRSP